MKKLLSPLLLLFMGSIIFTSCDKLGINRETKIGGNTDFAENKVGFKASGLTTLDGESIPQTNLEVVGNNNGIIELQFNVNLGRNIQEKINTFGETFFGSDYEKRKINYDSNGNISAKAEYINSDEGVAYIGQNGKQAVIMKYKAKKGNKWSYTDIDGRKFDMEVTHSSTTDDYDYSFFKIKVVKVEMKQKSFNPGYSKVVFIGNHKFGLVGWEVHLDDGSVLKTTKI